MRRWSGRTYRSHGTCYSNLVTSCTRTGLPSESVSKRKSANNDGASAFTTLNRAAATSRISRSPGMGPRTLKKYLRARAFAVTTILVSVALGRTLRAAERIALLNSFCWRSNPGDPLSSFNESRIVLYDSCEIATALRQACSASGDFCKWDGSTKVAAVSS